MSALSEMEGGVAIRVWVVPGASRSGIQGLHDDQVRIRVGSPPEGGRANREVADLLESALGAKVSLERGIRARRKVFVVTGMDVDTVRRKLGI